MLSSLKLAKIPQKVNEGKDGTGFKRKISSKSPCIRHNKGCNCKRSGCLKNYCECYEAKIPCSQYCKCQGCKNVDLETGAKVMCSPLKVGGPGPGGGAEVGGPTTPSLSINDRWFKPSTSLKSKLLQANTPLDTNDKGT